MCRDDERGASSGPGGCLMDARAGIVGRIRPPGGPFLMPRAVITGGSGFLGKAIRRHLEAQGFEAVSFDTAYRPKDDKHLRGSILNPDEVSAAVSGADVVFHIAGVLGTTELLSQNASAVEVNVLGTVNVLEACKLHGVQTIFYPTKPNDWLNTYSITKKAGEEFARMFALVHGMDVRILRWLNAYGPGQKAFPVRKAVPLMILQGLHHIDLEIWGDGDQPVDLIHTDDLARNSVLYTVTDCGDHATRDTGNTVRMTVNELAKLILRLTNSKAEVKYSSMRLGEDARKPVSLLSGPTAADILGLTDSTKPIEEGMAETVEYYAKLPSRQRHASLAFYYGREWDRSASRGDGVLVHA